MAAQNITAELMETTKVWTSTNPYEVASGAVYWVRCRQHRFSNYSASREVRDYLAKEHDEDHSHVTLIGQPPYRSSFAF